MPEVTVGVPVYNGAALLPQSLDCLLGQTYRDIEIIVIDNASTDDTAGVVEGYAARDPRVRLVRQPRNVGPVQNFVDVLNRAQSPYFLWRADDDLSGETYVEALLAAIKREPGKRLAVGHVRSVNLDGSDARERPFPRIEGLTGLPRLARMAFGIQAGWIYGLFERETLAERFGRFATLYGDDPWGMDHIVLLAYALREEIAYTPDALFIQRIKRVAGPRKVRLPPAAAMLALRRRFAALARAEIDAALPEGLERLALKAAVPFLAGKRTFRAGKIARAALSRRA